jgi:hypothetical protein
MAMNFFLKVAKLELERCKGDREEGFREVRKQDGGRFL